MRISDWSSDVCSSDLPVVPFGIAGVERAFDEQAAKARAVDEQVAFDDAAVVECERGYEAILGIEPDVGDLAFAAAHALFLGVAATEARIGGGVEMDRVSHRRAEARRGGQGGGR